jgi:nucleoside-diphosphate-sugar epimerase
VSRVLLTGGTGFIGRQAVPPLLEAGHEVHATFSRASGEARPGLTWHRANLLDPGDAEALMSKVRPTHLLHFAWYAAHGKFWEAPENLPWAEATQRLFRLFAEARGLRAVLAGSCAEYDWSALGDEACSERSTPLVPATLYGKSKHETHSAAEALAAEAGVSLAWGRIFFVYGPYEHPARLVPSLARSLLADEPAPTSEGSQLRDFLHSADVGSAFVSLLGSDVQGAVNIGSGESTPVSRVVDLIAAATGRPDLVRRGELDQRPGDPPVLVADVQRLGDEVGWKPGLSLEAGIEQAVEWWRKSG